MDMRYGDKKKSTKGKSGSEKTSYKDVVITLLGEGQAVVEKLVESGKLKVNTVRKAAESLKGQFPEKRESLLAFLDKVQPESHGRGRAAPKAGDERSYKAQKTGEHEPFLRLPLGALEIKKGQVVVVRFQQDRITVLKKAG